MYTKGKYLNKSEENIVKDIKSQGFNPQKFIDEPNYVYESHLHEETKLLVFLDGKMDITVGGEKFVCEKGDELLVHGNIVHSGKVGNEGCVFFWSEKII